MMGQGFVHQGAEAGGILGQHPGPLLKAQALGAVAAVVRNVAGSLIRQQIDGHVLVVQILQQVHNVAVVSNGAGLFGRQLFPGHSQGLGQAVRDLAHPALRVPGLDPGHIHLGNEGHSPGDLRRLALSAAHAAQAGGDV